MQESQQVMCLGNSCSLILTCTAWHGVTMQMLEEQHGPQHVKQRHVQVLTDMGFVERLPGERWQQLGTAWKRHWSSCRCCDIAECQ